MGKAASGRRPHENQETEYGITEETEGNPSRLRFAFLTVVPYNDT